MADLTCIHRMGPNCPICALDAEPKPPMSEERQSIYDYLKWASSVEVGTVLSPEQRQGVDYAASWVKNHLDRKPRE